MNDAEFLDDLEAKALHRHVEDSGQMWLSKADTDRLFMLLGCQPDEGMFAGFDYPAQHILANVITARRRTLERVKERLSE